MDRLPSFALQEVIVYLTPETAYRCFPLVCRRFYEETRQEQVYSGYLIAVFRLPQDCRLDFQVFTRILVQAFGATRENQQRLRLTGFATTGGVDSNNMTYWVGNMFAEYSLKGYCSEENKNNIVCAAVLSALLQQDLSPELEAAKRAIAKVIRSNHRLRSAVPLIPPEDSAEQLSEIEENIAMSTLFHRVLEGDLSRISDEQERRTKAQELLRHYSVLKASAVKLADVQQDPSNCYLLEKPINKDQIRAQNTFFWTREIVISRDSGFTCPVETFMVFSSMDFLPLESDQFSQFNNLRTDSDLRAFVAVSGLEIIHSAFNQNGCSYHEFRRMATSLQPILWGKFDSREGVKLEASLQQCFAGKYFYVKLICPENRMAEMNDLHQFTNIDIKSAAALGFVETLQ